VLAMSSASHAQDVAAGVMLDRYEALFADLTMPRLSNENIITYVLRRAANEDLAENGMISLLFRRLSVFAQQLANCSTSGVAMLLVDVMHSATTSLSIRLLVITSMPVLPMRKSSVD